MVDQVVANRGRPGFEVPAAWERPLHTVFEIRADAVFVSIAFVAVLVGLAYLLGKNTARAEWLRSAETAETAPAAGSSELAAVYRQPDAGIAPEAPFYVQVPPPCDLAEAERAVATLRSAGYASARYAEDPDRPGRYLLRVAGMATWEEAERIARMIRALELPGGRRFADAYPGSSRGTR